MTFENKVKIKVDPDDPAADLEVQMPGSIEIIARVKMGRLELYKQTGAIQLGGS